MPVPGYGAELKLLIKKKKLAVDSLATFVALQVFKNGIPKIRVHQSTTELTVGIMEGRCVCEGIVVSSKIKG